MSSKHVFQKKLQFELLKKNKYFCFFLTDIKGVFFSQDMFEALAFLIERYDDLAQGGATREDPDRL